jgi:hypothetical protein
MPAWAQIQLDAPASASIDGRIRVSASGSVPERSFYSVVAPDAPEGSYDRYSYYKPGQVELAVPSEPGDYQLRLLGPDRPYPTLASRPLRLIQPEVGIDAPASVAIGAPLPVRWRGPSGANEYLTIVPADAPEGSYDDYQYARGEGQGEVTLVAPVEPGQYQIRYLSGSSNRTLGSRPLSVGEVAAALEFAASVPAGGRIEVRWRGPGNARDFITIAPTGAPDREYQDYAYTRENPLMLPVPEAPGQYELRYLVADSSRVLARAPLTVGGVSATLQAPAQVKAGQDFAVAFSGPDNEGDYIAVTERDDPARYITYSYTRRGSPLPLRAPAQPGEYRVHYLTARDDRSLASQSIRVLPGDAQGSLRVLAGSASGPTSGVAQPLTVALILDASGSMLQRLDGRRRIELAREALDTLVASGLPDQARVALRVFGHRKPDACDTELLRRLGALDRPAMRAQIAGIEARNLAKTPIADSLRAVASDLEGVEGRALVVLVTDGEETCGGDPVSEIARLQQQGFQLVLNVVGFAVDEHALEREFARWAELGGGAYFSARDGAGLAAGIGQAVRLPFVVFRDEQRVAAGFVEGDAVPLPVGVFEVEVAGQRHAVEIRADEETRLQAGG